MSKYDALRSGFKELNRMLVDRQVFDAQMKAREAEDIRENQVLASNLAQKEFEREMAEKRYDLQVLKHEDQRNQDAWTRKTTEAKNKVDKEYREKKWQLDSRKANNEDELHEKQIINEQLAIDAHEMKNEITRVEVNRQRANQKPMDAFRVFESFGIDMSAVSQDPESMAEIKDIIGATVYNQETGQFENATGKPYQISFESIRPRIALVRELAEDATLTIPEMRSDLGVKTSELGRLKAEYKSLKPGDPRSIAAKNLLQKQISATEKAVSLLQNELSPEGLKAKGLANLRRAEAALNAHAQLGDADMVAMQQKRIDEMSAALHDPTQVPTIQRMAYVLDKEGNPVQTIAMNVPKGQENQSITPKDLDPTLGANAVWEATYKAQQDMEGKPDNVKTADWSYLHRAIGGQYGDATEDGRFTFRGRLGRINDITMEVAATMLQEPEWQDRSKLGLVRPEATRIVGMNIDKWLTFKEAADAKIKAAEDELGWGDDKAPIQKLREQRDEMLQQFSMEKFGTVIDEQTATEFKAWDQGAMQD